jgi:2-keto-3-deoxy-L-rhamnonate aldolase RhmA
LRENRVKRILREGGLALGTHVGGIADPQIVELIGLAGFDAAFIDMEHTSCDLHDVQLAVMAAERVGITPIVRTPGFDPAFILRLLDMGVQGIQVPHAVMPQPRAPQLRPYATRRSAIAAWQRAVAPPNSAGSLWSNTWRNPTARSCWPV